MRAFLERMRELEGGAPDSGPAAPFLRQTRLLDEAGAAREMADVLAEIAARGWTLDGSPEAEAVKARAVAALAAVGRGPAI